MAGEEGRKSDAGKPRTDLLPPLELLEVAEVYGLGAEKYAAKNYLQGLTTMRYMAAVLRHILYWMAGHDDDPETGKSTLAHAVCSLLIVMEIQRLRPDCDDRYYKHAPPPEPVERVQRA